MECGGSAKLGGGQEEVGIAKPVVGSSWCQPGAEGQKVGMGTQSLVFPRSPSAVQFCDIHSFAATIF